MRDRLAPVRQQEGGVRRLSLAEGRGRIVILEAVEQQHASEERWLGTLASAVGETHFTEALRSEPGNT